MMWDMEPPSPFKTVDTLLAARRYFRFPSNSLNDLCHMLGLGTKPKTTHASLWYDCLQGDDLAWKKMVKYNNNDVVLLEKLYLKLRPYIGNHPNVAVEKDDGCPRCGGKHLEYRGFYTTNVSTYHRLYCRSCGAWSRERLAQKQHPSKVTI
jgi:ribonuclease D